MNIDIDSILERLPEVIIIAAMLVIFFVQSTLSLAETIEEKLEKKYNKQIKIFDHKKIWLLLIWCIIATVILAVSGFIKWLETPFYLFVIMGIATFCYETVIKKLSDL